jgi:hypothetical protein
MMTPKTAAERPPFVILENADCLDLTETSRLAPSGPTLPAYAVGTLSD